MAPNVRHGRVLPALRRAAAAAMAVCVGTGTLTGAAAPAQAIDTSGSTGKSKWIVDGALTSLHDINVTIGATAAWANLDASGQRLTGKGVGVALIDSGIAPVKGLAQPGKVINGPDLSFESQAPNLVNLDTFGHGTHLAGIIAGRDPDTPVGKEMDPRYFVGVAPDARLVNLRVAATDGSVDVSQVIAAIDWAVTHRNDPGLNIRVINLSFGTDSLQDPRYDPLSYAVESAWRAGIVVVTSVGNDGPTQSRVSNPALNPHIIAVGAADTRGTSTQRDDAIGDFSTRGSTTRRPDLLAPGRSIAALRDPGSYIDTNYPLSRVADGTARFAKGSGTSQAAAVVSGAAALLLQQRPGLTPNQVKKILTGTAQPLFADAVGQGSGELNIKAAISASTPSVAAATQPHPWAVGTGSLERSRGTAHVADSETGVELIGERDIMGKAWNPATWTTASAAGTAWTGGTYNGSTWAGSSWTGTSWASRTWSPTTWTARTWSGTSWQARTWSTAGWTASGWTSSTWFARTWSARTWSARTWSGGSWNSHTWQ